MIPIPKKTAYVGYEIVFDTPASKENLEAFSDDLEKFEGTHIVYNLKDAIRKVTITWLQPMSTLRGLMSKHNIEALTFKYACL